MIKDFYDVRHAQSYLNSTIIRYDDTPVYVEDVFRGNESYFLDLSEINGTWRGTKDLQDDKLNLNPFPVGFINQEIELEIPGKEMIYKSNKAYSILRVPMRRWKIGLDSKACHLCMPAMQRRYIERNPKIRNLLFSDGFKNTVRNIFPTYTQVVSESTSATFISKAFSRRFCIGWDERLYFYNLPSPVGDLSRQEILYDKYHFLKEVLEQDINHG